jgi:GTPase-activating protein SAC7
MARYLLTHRNRTVVRDPMADSIQRKPISGDVIEDVSRMLAEIGTLRLRQPKEFSQNDPDCTLYNYMGCLKRYGEEIIRGTGYDNVQGAFVGDKEMFGAYVGDTPDSAIDLYEAPPFNSLREALTKNLEENGLYVAHDDEVEEAPDDDLSSVPSRAPTPPPRNRERLEGQRRNVMSPASSETTAQSLYLEPTTTSGGSPTLKSYPPPVLENSRFKKFMGHVSKRSFSELRPDSRMTIASSAYTGTTAASTDPRPSTPVIRASLVRRGGERLSVSIKKLPMWSNDLEELTNSEANAVFGVSLSKSIQIAKGTAKTHHNGTGSSRRDFPLCIHMCCTFLKNEGVEAPEIFSEPGDPLRVHKLKEIFSRPPTYGEDINWTNFGVYDAADLILLYLAQLPRPLVSEMTAKRWIKLSRQATISGSKGTRADQCIDFWEEALGTLRGPSRTLFKLLLNLWADIAEAADSNDMTAERLADVLLKPLMHNFTYKHKTDFMLAVAFMIRKRIEYQNMLKDEQKEARRARQMGW